MKIKNVLSAFLIAALIAVSAAGCNITDVGSDSLLRPPKTMGDEAEIEQLISDTAKNGYTLKYPKSGSYRSAIIMSDLDVDGTDEAVAFYRESEDVARIHMLVMYSDENEWKLSSDNITDTTDIDCVDFADVSGSDTLEILVGYSTYTQNINLLSCYSYSDGKTEEIKAGQKYSAFYCGDFTSDEKDEVMTLSLYTSENEASATMLQYDDNKKSLYSKAVVAMDPNVIKFRNVVTSDIGSETLGIFIDGEFATGEINTQIIYYSKELSLLRNPLYKEKTKNFTQRNCNVICTDIDNDMSVDFPAVQKLPHSDKEPSETVADKITWNSFSAQDESFLPKCSMIANYNFGFTVKIPDNWLADSVTAINSTKDNTTAFYEWKKSALGDRLFEIKVFDTAEWEKGRDNDDYTLIYKDNRYAYAFINSDTDSQFAMTDDEIKKSFAILTETSV